MIDGESMRAEDFTVNTPGRLVEIDSQGTVAFEPSLVPPELVIDVELARMIGETERLLGRLDGRGRSLSTPFMLIQPFIRREALASSRIEGTTAVIEDVLRFEAGDESSHDPDDVKEVLNYLRALQYGLQRPEERPVTAGFINELHQLILDDVRGAKRNPGRLRQIQVVIGKPGATAATARFVPPPPAIILGLLEQLLTWINQEDALPDLLRLAVFHYQFETIHPYEDGNGRLGRLLITLMLKDWGIMEYPLLYLSEYLEQHRSEYLAHLLSVSQKGTWVSWIKFFLTAIQSQAAYALETSTRLINYRESVRRRYQQGRTPAHLLNVVDQFFERAIQSTPTLAKQLRLSNEQIQRVLNRLIEDDIVREITNRERNRLFVAHEILAILKMHAEE